MLKVRALGSEVSLPVYNIFVFFSESCCVVWWCFIGVVRLNNKTHANYLVEQYIADAEPSCMSHLRIYSVHNTLFFVRFLILIFGIVACRVLVLVALFV